jgi:hypothetical protein
MFEMIALLMRGICILDIGACLGFGAWNLVFLHVSHNSTKHLF